MSTKKSSPHIFSVLFIIVFMLSVTSLQAAHAAGVHYAKPIATGTGDCLSWTNACTLQTALTSAVSGDEIWAKAGAHKPTTGTERTATFQLIAGVAIYGGFAGTEIARDQRNPATNLTVLSGDLNGDDVGFTNNSENVYHVVTGATGAILDGFTITAGNATPSGNPETTNGGGMYNYSSSPALTNVTFSGNTASHYLGSGGGMYNYSSSPALTDATFIRNSVGDGINSGSYGGGMDNHSSSPTLTNVTFSGNSATSGGGGMENYSSSSPVLTNVTFISNTASSGGGMYNYYNSSSPVLTNVTFISNTASAGGGMFNGYNSSPVLTNVTFSSNTANSGGGGMYNESGCNPTLTDVAFSGNTAGSNGGGGMYNNGNSTVLTNVTFSGNSAVGSSGGGMFNISSSPTLTNVTFSGNTSSGNASFEGGGGMYNSGGNPTLTNVTFSGNTASGVLAYNGGGGMYNSGSPTLTNVTFSGNNASTNGGGMYLLSGTPQIRNTIFWGNTAVVGAQIDRNGSTPILSYDVIQGGCPAGSTCTNIITTNPLLGASGNYGGSTQTIPLLPGSSAIDAGNGTYCPILDQRDESRSTPNCDIGAFESQGFSLVISGGNNQSAALNSGFVDLLSVTVSPLNTGEPVDGGQVTFTAPGSGASAIISGSSATISSGVASVTATANNNLGTYNVSASIPGVSPVSFSLENISRAFYTLFLPLILR